MFVSYADARVVKPSYVGTALEFCRRLKSSLREGVVEFEFREILGLIIVGLFLLLHSGSPDILDRHGLCLAQLVLIVDQVLLLLAHVTHQVLLPHLRPADRTRRYANRPVNRTWLLLQQTVLFMVIGLDWLGVGLRCVPSLLEIVNLLLEARSLCLI